MNSARSLSSSPAGLSRLRVLLGLAVLAPLLAACASTGTTTTPRPGKGAAIREPVRAAPRDPTFQTIPGLEGVIGASESQLLRQFGAARLNVWEGDARKLQFTGKACVLDVFLYPTAQSKEPLASYVDARRSSDGQDVDRAACVAALKGR
ncbi:hypothetical protein HNO88_001321 [Novosphingobium chloroacetimidivorans]|uniref:Lipoprotein n=1 Tax=Novosphingobium chloroacetimidivorans TaxID=1428314 RepID=A0A7W7NWE1_9SPHN|nr:hypothetical protein [Novosphingobium chloroacetimidivorans]MBB4858007.1 hypothetical protein [Novosphingobium chloroacetimidivorans]